MGRQVRISRKFKIRTLIQFVWHLIAVINTKGERNEHKKYQRSGLA